MQLILHDSKGKRSFEVGVGTLTLGSGADAQLRLTGQGVVARHAELKITETGVTLLPLDGAAPKVDGVSVTSATAIEPGQTIAIGAARIVLEVDVEEAPADNAAPGKLSPGVVRAKRGSTVAGRSRPAPRGRAGARAGTRSRGKSGVSPAKLALLTVSIAAVLGFVGWQVFTTTPSNDPNLLIATAEKMVANRERGRVEAVLAGLPAEAELTPEQRKRVEQLRYDLVNQRSQVSENAENVSGHRFFDEKLARFRDEHLAPGAVDERKVRYYLELCAEFEERWPTHPELKQIASDRVRLAPFGTLDAAPTWDQLESCVNHWTGGSPKRYRDAFRLIEEFLGSCGGTDCALAHQLSAKISEERAEYYDEKKLAAQTALEDGKPGLCVYWLIELAVNIGDAEMADRSARALLKIPNLEAYLTSLRIDDRYRYRILTENPLIGDFARSKDV